MAHKNLHGCIQTRDGSRPSRGVDVGQGGGLDQGWGNQVGATRARRVGFDRWCVLARGGCGLWSRSGQGGYWPEMHVVSGQAQVQARGSENQTRFQWAQSQTTVQVTCHPPETRGWGNEGHGTDPRAQRIQPMGPSPCPG